MNRFVLFGIISLVILIVTIILTLRAALGRYKSGRLLSPFQLFFAGVFLSIFFSLIPVYGNVLFSLHHTLQVFSLDIDKTYVLGQLPWRPRILNMAYTVYYGIFFLLAPILTFGIIASFFKNFSARVRFLLHFRGEVYAFSHLNRESLALAKSICSNPEHKNAVILFASAYAQEDESAAGLLEGARALKAICYKKELLGINFNQHDKSSPLYFFAIGHEKDNILLSLHLTYRYKDRSHTTLYTFARGAESELILSQNPGKVAIRRINAERSLIMRELYENGRQLFDGAVTLPDGSKKIGAVLVGVGVYGTEMLKALSWYCQMDGYHLYIDAFGESPHTESHLKGVAPELLSPDYNGVVVPGEAEYHIRIHSGCDFVSQEFYEEIAALKDTSFVFVSLGNDELNIRVAAELRIRYERVHIHPVIRAVVYDSMVKEAMKGVTDYNGDREYDIECIGDLESFYSEDVVINPVLEKEALRIHTQYGEREDFWKYEYNYRSSIASSIHNKLRRDLGVAGIEKPQEEWSDEERELIESIEHRRWNAYMRAEGFVYSGSPEKISRNNLGKMHHNLVPYAILSEEDKRKDGRVASQ